VKNIGILRRTRRKVMSVIKPDKGRVRRWKISNTAVKRTRIRNWSILSVED